MFRRALLFWIAGVVLWVPGCSRQRAGESTPAPAPPKTRAQTAAPAAPLTGKRIAVVPKGTVHEFWLTVKAGAEAAARETGVEVIWKGPAKETDVPGQIAILESFISQKVDAIVMAACDSKGLVATVQKAVDAGIPVVTIDSGVDSDLPISFVATDNPRGAGEAAHALAKLIGEKGEVGLIPFVAGAATSNMREQGFKDALKSYPGVKLVATLYSQSDASKAMEVTENMLQAHPNLAGIFAANEPGAVGAARALEQRGLAGKVKLVAFDASPAEIEALKKGTIQALVVQNPYRMGYDGVMAAVKRLRGETVPKRIDTGVTVVTAKNLSSPEVQQILYPLGKRG